MPAEEAPQRKSLQPVLPEGLQGKQAQSIRKMFNGIADNYDLLNKLISWGMDVRWRKLCIKKLQEEAPKRVLDLACGTGDMAISIAKALPSASITAVDMAEEMLKQAQGKAEKLGVSERISFREGDALDLPFHDNSFSALTIAFGIRNFEDLSRGLAEMQRVLQEGGSLHILELSEPASPLPRALYRLYSSTVLPLLGRWISGSRDAYAYLPQSIKSFPSREALCQLLRGQGFSSVTYKSLFPGVCCLYTAYKN